MGGNTKSIAVTLAFGIGYFTVFHIIVAGYFQFLDKIVSFLQLISLSCILMCQCHVIFFFSLGIFAFSKNSVLVVIGIAQHVKI